MASFARHYGYVSFYDLRGSLEAVERDLSICHPLMLHQNADEVCYLILREDAWPSLLANSEAQTRPLPEGVAILNHIPGVECWYPGDVPLDAIEGVICARIEQ